MELVICASNPVIQLGEDLRQSCQVLSALHGDDPCVDMAEREGTHGSLHYIVGRMPHYTDLLASIRLTSACTSAVCFTIVLPLQVFRPCFKYPLQASYPVALIYP